MAVAAAKSGWIPQLFGLIGRVGRVPNEREDDSTSPSTTNLKSDAPVNAIILSAILSTLYILFGNFRALLTFNGLGEYSFFFLAVLGAIILRFREPNMQRPYKPFLVVPVVFAIVSGFVVIRGAIFAPVLALVLIGLWVAGVLFYWVRPT
jgi:solute carrier family 7 (L-type amino acid transporter), member 9/15